MEVSGRELEQALRRTQMQHVAVSLVPLGVLAYLVGIHVLPILQEQNEDLLILCIILVLILTAGLSFLGYAVSRKEALRAAEEIDLGTRRLSRMARASGELMEAEGPEAIANSLALHTRRVLDARAVLVWLPDDNGLKAVGSAGAQRKDVRITLEKGHGIAWRVFQGGVAQRNVHLTREDKMVDEAFGIHTLHAMAVPLSGSREEPEGALTVHERRDGTPFTELDLELVSALALQGGQALCSRSLTALVEGADEQRARVMASLLESHLAWPEHVSHVERVALQIARQLHLDEAFCRTLRIAAMLHDIGLAQPLCSPEGRAGEVLASHPARGAAIVASVPQWQGAAALIRCHHEHRDGSGYPEGLEGYDIPLGARILAVSEWWDERTNLESPFYHYSPEEALQRLIDDDGARFDQPVVRALRDLLESNAQTSAAS